MPLNKETKPKQSCQLFDFFCASLESNDDTNQFKTL